MIVARPLNQRTKHRFWGIPWSAYVAFCDGVGERYIRMTYKQGALEIMSVSSTHGAKNRVWRVVEVVTEELEIDMDYGGSMTCRKEEMSCALEPDDCFWIEHAPAVHGLGEIDLDRDPPPDLAHEIEISRSALDRMSIYAALKVPEVWRWDGQALTVHLLNSKGVYRVSKRSKAFPFLPLDELVAFLNGTTLTGLPFTRACRAWVRENRAAWKK